MTKRVLLSSAVPLHFDSLRCTPKMVETRTRIMTAFIQNYVYQSVKIHLFGDSFALGNFLY